MKFYSIQHSSNPKVIGKYPQVESVHNNCHIWDEPKFVEHINFKKVDFEPIVSNAILNKKSKQTDLIKCVSMGFSKKLLISGKLKTILEKSRKSGLQFFNSPIVQNNQLINDYWLLNMFIFNYEYIDISKSIIFHNKKSEDYKLNFKTNKERIYFENFKQFEDTRCEVWKNSEELITIEKLNLLNEIIYEDFFMLNYVFGSIYYVSEKLKKEIEDAGCTGIEFQPTELSFIEWIHSVEREKNYGKY